MGWTSPTLFNHSFHQIRWRGVAVLLDRVLEPLSIDAIPQVMVGRFEFRLREELIRLTVIAYAERGKK